LRFLKIDVIPLQRQQFTHAQACEHIEQDRRARRFPQQAKQRDNLLDRKHNRNL
jgi:hypothetical protein